MRSTLPVAAAFLAGFALTATGDAPAQNAYVGAFAGVALFDSTVTVGGVKLVDQGGDAAMAGVRAGWGRAWPAGLYLGGEVEGFAASGRSRAVVNGQVYSLSLRGGAGAYGRIGFAPADGRALFFARAGVQAVDTSQGWQTTPAVGLGAEVPFLGTWAARIDAGYAWGSDGRELYSVTAGLVRRW
jgi:hypothetical protein